MKDLKYYISCFSSLHTMKKMGKPAPHKALLLLSVIELVERGIITDCRVPLSNSLEKQFKHNTTKLLGESVLFQPRLVTHTIICVPNLFGNSFRQQVG